MCMIETNYHIRNLQQKNITQKNIEMIKWFHMHLKIWQPKEKNLLCES